MSETHPNLERRLGEIQTSIEKLESWRALIVDPKLTEHDTKISAFERMEMQITGVVRFVKIIAATVGVTAGLCEVVRAIEPFLRK